MRLILDTNVLVSALMLPERKLGRSVLHVIGNEEILMSFQLWAELVRVITRTKFQKYLDLVDAAEFLAMLLAASEEVNPRSIVTDCRDPNDNHVLALALDGKADILVTGDDDLLVLHPWRGVAILSPAEFMGR